MVVGKQQMQDFQLVDPSKQALGGRLYMADGRLYKQHLPVVSNPPRNCSAHGSQFPLLKKYLAWTRAVDWLHRPTPLCTYRKFKTWWDSWTDMADGDRVQKAIYTMWNLWNKRCRRVSENKAMVEPQLRYLIQTNVDLCRIAWPGLARQSEVHGSIDDTLALPVVPTR
jgi:hypothetical protein